MKRNAAVLLCAGLLVLMTRKGSGSENGSLSIPAEAARSPFGIEYVFPGRPGFHTEQTAETYKDIGAKWVKFQYCPWKMFEPNAPRDGTHTYTWQQMDNHVRWWQERGFQIQVCVKCLNEWAVQDPKLHLFGYPPRLQEKKHLDLLKTHGASNAPKAAHRDDWMDFIGALVERYDGDGIDDMPGLRFPILYYESESEAQHWTYWLGSLEDYAATLKMLHKAAKEACPEVRIILSGIELGGTARDGPDDEVMRQRRDAMLERLTPGQKVYFRNISSFIEGSLALGDYYDIVEFHALVDYTAIPGTAAYLRRKLAELGYEKEIWAGDASSAPEVGTLASLFGGPENYEGPRGRICRILATPDDPEHAEIKAWYQREQASLTVKKYIVAIEARLAKIFMASLEDWVGSPWPNHGLTNRDGTPRPVYRAIQFLTRTVDGFEDEKRLELGEGIYAFQFVVGGNAVYVLWYELDQNQLDLPSSGDPAITVSLPVNASQARVIDFDMMCKNSNVIGELRSAGNGAISLKLDRYPAFVKVSHALDAAERRSASQTAAQEF